MQFGRFGSIPDIEGLYLIEFKLYYKLMQADYENRDKKQEKSSKK